MNITRSDHQNTTTATTASSSSSTSGGKKQQQINVLSKEVQLHLRKKRYDYWSNKKKMIVDAVLVHDDVDVVTEVATAAAVDVDVDIPVVINTIIANSQIKNDDIAASDDSNGNDGNMRVTFGDTIINNSILNEYITDPLSTDTSTTPSTTIITASTKNDNNSSILSTAPIPMLTPTPPIPIPSQHHSILVPSICLSTITTLHKPVGEVSLKPYPTKSMKLLDFSDKVFYLFLLLL
jgi:predicted phage tail protein